MSTIIILNGVSSAGKSSIAKALQKLAGETFLRVALDDFIAMLPQGREFGRDWFPVVHHDTADGPLPRIENGKRGTQILAEMRRMVGGLARCGFDVVVDEACDAEAIRDYRVQAGTARLLVVKVDAPIATIQQRERERGDRLIGLGRGQAMFLHYGIEYDLTLDSSTAAPPDLAATILGSLRL